MLTAQNLQKRQTMAESNITPNDESKKDTVRINLPAIPGQPARTPAVPGVPQVPRPTVQIPSPTDLPGQPVVASAPTGAAASDVKKETAMMNLPPAQKKETAPVMTAAKPIAPDMPRPTVRLRREPGVGAPAAGAAPAATPPPASRASVPEMPRPTVKLKVEEPVAAAPSSTASTPSAPAPAAPAPITVAAGPGGLDLGLSIAACVLSLAVVGYLIFAVGK